MGYACFEHVDFLAAPRELAAGHARGAVTVDSVVERLKAPNGSFYYRFASRNPPLGELWLKTVLAYQEGRRRCLISSDTGSSAATIGAEFCMG